MSILNRPLTPSQKAKLVLKKRVLALKEFLPNNWIVLYTFEHPDEKDQAIFLRHVLAGKSLHEPTIVKLEKLVKALKEKKLTK